MRPRRAGLALRLAAAFIAVTAAMLVAVLLAVERVTSDTFGAYADHLARMPGMMGGSAAMPDPQAFLLRLRSALLLAGLAGLASAASLAILFARRMTRPLRELRSAARRLGDGETAVRVRVAGDDEVAELGRSFNAMAASLAAADGARRAFLADVAHELRTPLSVLQAEVEALQDGLATPTEARLASLAEEVRLLSRLVDDLRTLSLLDSGELRLQPEPVPLDAALFRSAEAVGEAARSGIDIEVLPDGGLPPAWADPLRVQQVMRILLSNAMHHARSRITIRARASGGALRVGVDDDGPGIDETALPRIFDRFYRADASRSRASGGTGLGLAIARELVEAQGGRIHASNRPRGGASFEFTLPAVPPPASAPAAVGASVEAAR